MEKESKKSSLKTTVIIILSIMLLCSVGYIAYDKYNESLSNKKAEEKPDEIINEDLKEPSVSGFSVSNKTEIQNLSSYNYRILVSKDGHAFLTVESYEKNSDVQKENIKNLQAKYSLNVIEGYCNTDGEFAAEICPDGNSVNSIKLDLDSVIAAYDTVGGQEIYGSYIIFLMEDGTISRINKGKLFEEGLIEIEKNVDNLSNIVTIVQSASTGIPSGYHEILAIENDGTQHTLVNKK